MSILIPIPAIKIYLPDIWYTVNRPFWHKPFLSKLDKIREIKTQRSCFPKCGFFRPLPSVYGTVLKNKPRQCNQDLWYNLSRRRIQTEGGSSVLGPCLRATHRQAGCSSYVGKASIGGALAVGKIRGTSFSLKVLLKKWCDKCVVHLYLIYIVQLSYIIFE